MVKSYNLNLLIKLLFFSCLYILVGKFGISFVSLENSSLTLVWLPAGIGAYLAIKYGKIGLAVIFISSFIVNSPSYFDNTFTIKWLLVSLIASSGDTLQSFFVSFFVKDELKNFEHLKKDNLIKFFIKAIVLPPLLTCWILVLNNFFFGYIAIDSYNIIAKLVEVSIILNLADMTGILLILPLLLIFNKVSNIKKFFVPINIFLIILITLIGFVSTIDNYLIYLSFIPLLFLTYKNRIYGVVLGSFILNISIILFASQGIMFSEFNHIINYAHILTFIFSSTAIFYLLSSLLEEIEEKSKLQTLLIQQSKMAEMGEMMGAIAHQWRQPLNTLALIVQKVKLLYKKEMLSEKEIVAIQERAMKQINFMSKTIDDFRNFFKPSKQKEEFFIYEAIDDVINILSAQFKVHNISINIAKTQKIKIVGYRNEFKQVLLNLLNNSKDAILEKQQSDKSFSGRVSIDIFENEKYLYINIEDNGVGVPLEIVDKIFNPYFSTKGTEGTGVGLYISKVIIENNMQGELSAKNRINGICFSIQLPII